MNYKFTNIRILPILVLLILSNIAGAQELEDENYERVYFLDFNFSISDLQGNFDKNNPYSEDFGLGTSFLIQSKVASPWFYGIEINYLRLGSLSTNFEEQIGSQFFTINTTSSLTCFNFTPKLRYYLPIGYKSLSPFAELGFNYKWLYTFSTEEVVGDDEINSDLHNSSGSIGYQAAFGVNILLKGNYYLLLKSAYNFGVSTDYLVQNEFIDHSASSRSNLISKNSTTNMINYQIGITILL
jgi:hypothetical protein